jgi:hypothetical protein
MRHSLSAFPAVLLALTITLAVLNPPSGVAADDHHSMAIAVLGFNYNDTSGEVRDQTNEHAARLDRFMSALKADLGAQGKFRVVVPVCRSEPCTPAQSAPADVLEAARAAGADLLMTGTIHKMSTLVQWAKVEVIDTKSGQPAMEKLFTFRGDSDDAWVRAEAFIADEVTTHKWNDQ